MIQNLVKIVITSIISFSFAAQCWAHANPPGCEDAAAAIKKAQNEYSEARKAFYEAEDKYKKKKSEVASLNRMFSNAEMQSGQALSELDLAKEDQATCEEYNNNPDGIPPLFDCDEVPERIKLAQEKVEAAERAIQEIMAKLDVAEAELAQLEEKLKIAYERKEAARRAVKEAQDAWAALGCHRHA